MTTITNVPLRVLEQFCWLLHNTKFYSSLKMTASPKATTSIFLQSPGLQRRLPAIQINLPGEIMKMQKIATFYFAFQRYKSWMEQVAGGSNFTPFEQ